MQGLEYNKTRAYTDLHSPADEKITTSDKFDRSYRQPLPTYEVLPSRKFEFSELCEIFLGSSFKKLYMVALFFYMTFICWSYATIVGTSWSLVIPWGPSDVCSADDFANVYIPSNVKCKETYWFYTVLFGVIVIPLGCFELKGQKYIQVCTSRFHSIYQGKTILQG